MAIPTPYIWWIRINVSNKHVSRLKKKKPCNVGNFSQCHDGLTFAICLIYTQVALLLSKMPTNLVGEKMETQEFYDALNVILSLQVWFFCLDPPCCHSM